MLRLAAAVVHIAYEPSLEHAVIAPVGKHACCEDAACVLSASRQSRTGAHLGTTTSPAPKRRSSLWAYALIVPVALVMCLLLVIALPLVVVGLLTKRFRPPRPASPPLPPIGPQWAPDPSGRHEYRFWNGTSWTAQVSDHGALSIDALDPYVS